MDQKIGKCVWRLLKGGVEKGETKTQALRREIFEEVGLKNIRILERIHSYKFVDEPVDHRVTCYLVKADSTEPIKIEKSEISDYVWTRQDKASEMLCWTDEQTALKKFKQAR